MDNSHTNQYILKTKEEELRVTVYYTALDQIINGISIRFNQKPININTTVANLLTQQTGYYDVYTLERLYKHKNMMDYLKLY